MLKNAPSRGERKKKMKCFLEGLKYGLKQPTNEKENQ